MRRKEILAQLTKNIEKQSITFFLKEKVTPKSVFFLSSPIKSSYLVEVLTEVSALIKVHAIPRNASVAAILKQVLNGQAAKRDVISPRRFCLYSRSWLIFTRFEPERVPNAEDSEIENEEVNNRLEGTFWCTCEGCETMPTQKECVFRREQPGSENKMEVRIIFKLILHWSR